MDTPVSKSVPSAAVEVEIPRRMFFDAKDYAPHAKPRVKPTEEQAKVSQARSDRMGELHRGKEKIGSALRHVRVADDCGLVTQSVDVLLVAAEDFLATVKLLAKAADNAETRYEQAFEATPPAPTTAFSMGGPSLLPVSMTISPKPSAVNYPATMADAWGMRSAALGGASRAAGQG